MKRAAYAVLCVASIGAVPGCIPPSPRGFDSPDPIQRMAAITEAGMSEDESAIPDLIRMLESTDPGARLLAIRSLERLTGQTLGYDYAAPMWERSRAVEQWKAWARTRPGSETASAPGVAEEG